MPKSHEADSLERSWRAIGTAVSFVAAGWTIFQNEFSSIKETATADRTQATVYYNANKDELGRREVELKAELDKIRRDFLSKDEHRAYLEGTKEQLESLRSRVSMLEVQQASNLSRLAHDPVEDRTFQAVAKATDDKINLLQNQMQSQTADLNLQLAAALKAMADINANATRRQQP